MNADEYQKLAMRTAATPDLFNNNVDGSMDDVLHALLGIGTEAGELQDMFKKHLMYGKAFDRTNLIEECGDLLWYIALALKTVNVTMSDCMERNIKKLQVRYPQKFTTENALNRNLEQEARALTAPADEWVVEVASTPEPSAPPEPGVPAEVRPWLDALRVWWPEMRAGHLGVIAHDRKETPTWAVSRAGFTDDECDAFMCASGSGWLLGARHEEDLVTYYTPAALVAALKKALGEETR